MAGGADILGAMSAAGRARELREEAELALSLAAPLPPPGADAALVVLSGLPGAGKSTFARRLREAVPLAVLESDALRASLAPAPSYSRAESRRVFEAVHAAAASLLAERIRALIDATNLIERERAILYRVAGDARARLIMVRVTAPLEVIRERIARRAASDPAAAGMLVLERMRRREERIATAHRVVDTSGDIQPAVTAVAREITGR